MTQTKVVIGWLSKQVLNRKSLYDLSSQFWTLTLNNVHIYKESNAVDWWSNASRLAACPVAARGGRSGGTPQANWRLTWRHTITHTHTHTARVMLTLVQCDPTWVYLPPLGFSSRFLASTHSDSWAKKTARYLTFSGGQAQLMCEQGWLLATGIERSTRDQWQECCIDPSAGHWRSELAHCVCGAWGGEQATFPLFNGRRGRKVTS